MNRGSKPTDKTPGERALSVSFPELPIASYLRFLEWSELTAAAILDEAALEAIRKGSKTLTFNVSAPLRLWSEGITNSLRFSEWVGRLEVRSRPACRSRAETWTQRSARSSEPPARRTPRRPDGPPPTQDL